MALTNPIYIVYNRQNGLIVPNFNGSVSTIPKLPQNNVRDLRIQFVDPTGGSALQGISPWAVANLSGATLAAYISAQPLGTGGPTPATSNPSLTYDTTNNWFAGQIDLTQTGITTLLTGVSQITAYLEFDLSVSGTTSLTTLDAVTLFAVVNKSAVTPNPLPATSFPTTAQADAAYVHYVGDPGIGFILTTPLGKQLYVCAIDTDAGAKLDSQPAN